MRFPEALKLRAGASRPFLDACSPSMREEADTKHLNKTAPLGAVAPAHGEVRAVHRASAGIDASVRCTEIPVLHYLSLGL